LILQVESFALKQTEAQRCFASYISQLLSRTKGITLINDPKQLFASQLFATKPVFGTAQRRHVFISHLLCFAAPSVIKDSFGPQGVVVDETIQRVECRPILAINR